uniref:Uncharacterized protein n=1 Tax=Chrysotila carterae TaxID=13221 RepID=A0A7S4B297_CHRCT|eukprot:1099500-Pleurochrysis_carterae.AAC.5
MTVFSAEETSAEFPRLFCCEALTGARLVGFNVTGSLCGTANPKLSVDSSMSVLLSPIALGAFGLGLCWEHHGATRNSLGPAGTAPRSSDAGLTPLNVRAAAREPGLEWAVVGRGLACHAFTPPSCDGGEDVEPPRKCL